jgi:hypothetical protein
MEQYIYELPCGCGQTKCKQNDVDTMGLVHPNLSEALDLIKPNTRMNVLDQKRRKKISHNLESLKGWISTNIEFDENKRFEIVKELYKISRALKQLAVDVNISKFICFILFHLFFF